VGGDDVAPGNSVEDAKAHECPLAIGQSPTSDSHTIASTM
jgi:hypothetical protein